jgi:hypothetical protein
MKKFLVLFILVGVNVYFIGPYIPYWGLMILVAIISFFSGASPSISFFGSGFSFGLVWLILSIWISVDSQSNLPKSMSELMGLSNDNLLWFITGIVGFIVGSFSGLTGGMLNRILQKKDTEVYRIQS